MCSAAPDGREAAIAEVARVMEYTGAYELYRDDRSTA